ncbi:SDR family NAD(P)-dependent oxidoreductase [Streptomyces indonesiensis]
MSQNPAARSEWALITGSTSGIGRETAIGLAQDGYSVIVTGRSKERAAEVRESIEARGGHAVDLLADLSDPSAVRTLIAQVGDTIGDAALEVLVNNAGGGGFAPTEATSEAMFDAAFNTHVKAPYMLVGAFAPAMATRGRGVIINIGSMSTNMAPNGTSAFQASKGAISMLTKSWTAEYGPRGVRVNSVDPGFVITPANEAYREGYGGFVASLPAGRGAAPEEIAEAIRFWSRRARPTFTGSPSPSMAASPPSSPCKARISTPTPSLSIAVQSSSSKATVPYLEYPFEDGGRLRRHACQCPGVSRSTSTGTSSSWLRNSANGRTRYQLPSLDSTLSQPPPGAHLAANSVASECCNGSGTGNVPKS